MKKFLASILLTFTILLSQQATSFAASGSAIIPHFLFQTAYNTNYYVSNITNAETTVYVKFFDKNGTLITSSSIISGTNLTNFTVNPGGTGTYSASFTIDGKKTGHITLINTSSSSNEFGHGEIEWTQDSDAVYSLVCTGRLYFHSSPSTSRAFSMAYQITINNSKPF